MQLWQYGVGFSAALGLGLALGGGCAAGGNNGTTGSTAGTGGSGAGTGGGLITTSSGTGSSGGAGGFGACAEFHAEAKQVPAAMLIVLDRTASMSGSKWSAAQIAVVQAIDKDVFDTMSLGLLTFPAPSPVPGPDCILNFPIFCDVSALPQVAVKPAGTQKSADASGVRSQIYQYLVNNSPQGDDISDSSPIYGALNGAYQFIKGVTGVDKRIVVLITDGGGSCTSVANPPRQAYVDGNGCFDWEEPPIMADLINKARQDGSTPVNTFIVGVPGSNSHGEKQGAADTPPYSMLLALSTYAIQGSPETLDPSCDKGTLFSAPPGQDPAHPCHIDLSSGNNFNAGALADAITAIRGKALSCTYDLPQPMPGESVDPGQVNVVVTVDGTDYTIPKRKDPADMCAAEPCWDYDAQGKVQLIGITCSTVSSSTNAKVEIYVGCATVIK